LIAWFPYRLAAVNCGERLLPMVFVLSACVAAVVDTILRAGDAEAADSKRCDVLPLCVSFLVIGFWSALCIVAPKRLRSAAAPLTSM
jgi:hypothetical protein